MYLIDYIAYGLHLWYKIRKIKEIYRKPIDLHPGLGNSLIESRLRIALAHSKSFHSHFFAAWLGGALAGQKNMLYGLGQNPVAGKKNDTSRF